MDEEIARSDYTIEQLKAIIDMSDKAQSEYVLSDLQQEVVQVAEDKIRLDEILSGGMSPKVGDSSKGSKPTGCPCSDCEEIC